MVAATSAAATVAGMRGCFNAQCDLDHTDRKRSYIRRRDPAANLNQQPKMLCPAFRLRRLSS
jgi:hypothetical protein